MRRALLFLASALGLLATEAGGQALSQKPQVSKPPCQYVDEGRFCGGSSPVCGAGLLNILLSGPPYAQGTLTTLCGATVTDTRANSVYAYNGTNAVLLGSNTVVVESASSGLGVGEGLRVEASHTNVLKNSQNLTGTGWAAAGITVAAPTVTANSSDVTDPAGGHTATKIVLPTVTGFNAASEVSQAGDANAVAHAYSLYLATASGTALVYLSGVKTATGTDWHSTSCSLTTTWKRCNFTFTQLSGFTYAFIIGIDTRDGSQAASGAPQTFYAWQADDVDSSAVMSPCLTTSAGAACGGDDISTPNTTTATSTFNACATVAPSGSAWTATGGILAAGTGASSWSLSLTASGKPTFTINDGTNTALTFTKTTVISAASHRVCGVDAAGTLSINVDGSSASGATTGSGTGVLGSQPATLLLGETATGVTNPLNGWETNICVGGASCT